MAKFTKLFVGMKFRGYREGKEVICTIIQLDDKNGIYSRIPEAHIKPHSGPCNISYLENNFKTGSWVVLNSIVEEQFNRFLAREDAGL